ncbi:hypothetical protein KCP74_10300 [Salmonella enterica subsp. enterica]|nr:hypothetical protein KCP74_10300 [Salmonella enterica subsp. enterica]
MSCRRPPVELPQDRLAGVGLWCATARANSHAAIMRARCTTRHGRDIQPSVLLSSPYVGGDGYRGELLVDPEPSLFRNISGSLV